MKNCMKRWLKWLLLTLALAIAAEALLFWVAGTFGKSTGEMSLNRPSSLWLTWHLPGIALGFLAFGHAPAAGPAVAALMIATGILQFFVIFLPMIALAASMKTVIQWLTSKTGLQGLHVMRDYNAFRKTAIRYWEFRRIIHNLALVPAAFLGYALAGSFAQVGGLNIAHVQLVVFWLAISALGANLCYSFAYVLEFFFGCDEPKSDWLRFGRTSAFVAGVLFAMFLALIGGWDIADMQWTSL